MMHPVILIFILISLCREHISYTFTYDKYTLFRGTPKTERQLGFFQNLSVRYYVNYWTFPGKVDKPVDFVISPRDREQVIAEALWSGIELTPVIENIQESFNNQTISYYVRRRTDTFNWKAFYKINDIYGWLEDLAANHPSEMTVRTIGKTHEGRDIKAVDIYLTKGISRRPRPKVFIEGGIHGREWIAPAFVTYLINEIINSQESPNIMWRVIARHYEWHIVPVLNPDGYVFSHEKNRMWRKNRNKSGAVDLNRNFAHVFCSVGASKIKHTETYCGTHAFSEPESRAMGDYVRSHSKDLRYYFGFHAYGQLMIIPYANSKEKQENYNQMVKMARIAAIKIERRYKIQYHCGTAYDTVGYFTSGVSACWVKRTFGVTYVMVFELRDQGRYGFALPTDQILPTCIETMDGLISLLDISGKPYLSQNEELKLIERERQSGNRGIQALELILFLIILLVFV